MRVAALLLLVAGCDRVLGLSVRPLIDASTPDTGIGSGSDASTRGPKLVEQMTAMDSSTITLSIELPSAAIANTFVLIGGAEAGVLDPVGGGVKTWQLASSSFASPGVNIWFGVIEAPTTSITLTSQNGTTTMWADLTEWSGLAATSTFDGGQGAGSNSITGTGVATLATTTNAAPDLILLAASYYQTIGNPSGTWTALQPTTTTGPDQHAWYRIASVAGMQQVDLAYTGPYDAALAALRASP